MFDKNRALSELEALKEQVANANKLLTAAQTRKTMHESNIAAKENELREMGVDPAKVDETLETLIAEYGKLLAEAKSMIPTAILEKAKVDKQS